MSENEVQSTRTMSFRTPWSLHNTEMMQLKPVHGIACVAVYSRDKQRSVSSSVKLKRRRKTIPNNVRSLWLK